MSHKVRDSDESIEKIKLLIDEIPDISDEEVLLNLISRDKLEELNKYLIRKSISFESIKNFRNAKMNEFLNRAILVSSAADIDLLKGSDFNGLTDAEKKEILKDILLFSKKEKDEILTKIKEIKEESKNNQEIY